MLLVNARLPFISLDVELCTYQPVQLFCLLVTFGVASIDSLTRLRLTAINRDRTRPSDTFIYTILESKKLTISSCMVSFYLVEQELQEKL